jgi:hypothetical protein
MIKNYIFIGLILILVVFGLIMSIKCSSLERENIKLRVEHNTTIDSIKVKNEALETNILLLEEELVKCAHKIDSLKKLKQRVIVKYKYVISNDLTEGVGKLKENLKCEVY